MRKVVEWPPCPLAEAAAVALVQACMPHNLLVRINVRAEAHHRLRPFLARDVGGSQVLRGGEWRH